MPGSGFGTASWFGGDGAWQWAHHDATCFRLPPRIDDGASFTANRGVVPHPCFGVDPFANRS